MNARALILDKLTVTLAGRKLVHLDTAIPAGEVRCLVGPSGSGKSTALAALAGTLAPDFRWSGRALLDGAEITTMPPWKRRLGLLFQDALLFPHLSVAGNLALGLAPQAGEDRRARIEAALERIGLAGSGKRDPAGLSGGQQARVALMRTLLSKPRALLLDEPFASLDRPLRREIRSFVFALAREEGLPVLLVTHDPEDVETSGNPALSPLGAAVTAADMH